MWTIVAGMLTALVLQLRAQPRTRATPDEPTPEPSRGKPGPTLDARGVPLDADGLLARATEHAARGEHDAAVSAGHGALLLRLAERGHIRLQISRTNGDHLRDLRSTPELREATSEVVVLAERVQFGHASIGAPDVERLLVVVRRTMGTLASLVSRCGRASRASHGVEGVSMVALASGTAVVLALLPPTASPCYRPLRSPRSRTTARRDRARDRGPHLCETDGARPRPCGWNAR